VMEFLRVCQREGLFRLERDRRGQIRVFPGSGLQSASTFVPEAGAGEERTEAAREVIEAEPVDNADDGGLRGLAEGGQPDVETVSSVSAEAPIPDVIEHEQPAPVKTRRARKAPSAGKPPARKSTGARTTSRRRKVPVPAA